MLQAGVRIGNRYLLRQRVGAGGMGEVWLAVDEVLGRTVAVKVMLAAVAGDPDFAKRFEAEATSMARINHPAVASIHDFGRDQGTLYLVMEFVDGESLAQRLSRGRLAPAETMRLIEQAAAGLQAVHDQGLVHRDIKPANLLVRRDGSVVITDFGIARHESASQLTASGAILGTPTYLSPEQVRGEPAGPLSDVYSLGLVAYECLAGEKPFVGDNPYAVALQRLQGGPRTIKVDLPVPVQAVVERALAVDPLDRWPSARELAGAAREALTGPQPVPLAAVPRPGSRTPVLLAALAGLLIVVGGVVAWEVVRQDGGVVAAPETETETGQTATTPDLFTECETGWCPTEPLCWGGLVSNSGVASPPRREDCGEDHYWETFAAVPLPAGGVTIGEQSLATRPDAAAMCNAEFMATRSRDPEKTRSWQVDAWPVPVGATTMLHCIASGPGGEVRGSHFTPMN
ncbi:MAG TPA: serine/threonine-protein kinase [Actinoplanes sp.]|nr:serine/threonine-protein kinase [Actinoplanes sp.]